MRLEPHIKEGKGEYYYYYFLFLQFWYCCSFAFPFLRQTSPCCSGSVTPAATVINSIDAQTKKKKTGIIPLSHKKEERKEKKKIELVGDVSASKKDGKNQSVSTED